MFKIHRILSGVIIIILIILFGCESNKNRKIKLATNRSKSTVNNHTISSVLQFASQEQKTVTILLFRNNTGDTNLDWLQRGLADMLTTDLKQSSYLNVITPARFSEIAQQFGLPEEEQYNREELTSVAKKAQIQTVLSGKYYKENGKLKIAVDLWNIDTSKDIQISSVEGESLEHIFTMVNELSDKVRTNLQGNLEKAERIGVDFTQMTNSVDAFKCYSKALENFDKLLSYEAEMCLHDAIKFDTTFAAAYLRLAIFEIDHGKGDEGRKFLNKAKKHSNRLSEVDKLRLEIIEHHLEGNWSKSIQLLKEAVERYPTDIESRINLASVYHYFLGGADLALQQYEIALELDPTQKLIYNNLGYLYANRGEFTTAFKYFDKYQELAPDEPNPHDSKGEILMRAGRFDEAIEQLNIALEKWPSFHYSNYRLVELYTELGDYKNASKYVSRIHESQLEGKLRKNFHTRHAMMYWRFGKIQEAEQEFKKAFHEKPINLNAYLRAGEMYRSIGDENTAKMLYYSAFENLKQNFNPSSINFIYLGELFEFFYYADLPKKEVIAFLENLSQSKSVKNTDFRVILDFLLGVMYLRNKQPEIAGEFLKKDLSQKIRLIAQNPESGWDMWGKIMEVLDLERDSYTAKSSTTNQFLEFAKNNGRKDIENMVNLAIARMNGQLGNLQEVQQIFQKLGAPLETNWYVIGPFSLGNYSGFHHLYAPEEKTELTAQYENNGKHLKWIPANDGHFDGYIDLKKIFKQSAWAVGYGLIYVYSPDQRKVQIRLGSDEAIKVWLNNKQIWQHYISNATKLDRDLVTVLLNSGYNKLLVKVTNNVRDWGYFLRVTDENGNGFSDITFHSFEDVEKTYAANNSRIN